MKKTTQFISVFVCTLALLIPSLGFAKKTHRVYRAPAGKTPVIYKDPTVHSDVVKKLPANCRWIVRLPGVKKYSNETWYQVSWNYQKGWVKKSQLVIDTPATNMALKNPKCLNKQTRVKSCNSI